MFFFDDFLKKVENAKYIKKDIKKYRLETKKVIVGLGTGVPLMLIGGLQGYIGYTENKIVGIIVALGILFLGVKHLKKVFSYSVKVDTENKMLKSEGLNLDLNQVELCELKEGVVGKGNKLQVILRVITKDKHEIIIPLIMNNKVDFVVTIKECLDGKINFIKK